MLKKKIDELRVHGVKIGRMAAIISFHGDKAVLKCQPDCMSTLSRLSRTVVGGSLPFLNEYAVNMMLLKNDFKYFSSPTCLDSEKGSYLIFKYESGESIETLSQEQVGNCLKSLREFNVQLNVLDKPFIERVLFALLERPPYRVCRLVLRGQNNFITKMKILYMIMKFSVLEPKIGPVLLHNDLAFSNKLLTPENRFLFLDFEDSVSECLWILVDVIDVLFDRDRLWLDIPVVKKYWDSILEHFGQVSTSHSFKQQVRVCVLRHTLYSQHSVSVPVEERIKMNHFLNVLLNNESYNQWFEDCDVE